MNSFSSVIIACYNASPYVEEAVLSVIGQSGNRAIECIVVDDGSRDDSLAKVERLAALHPQVRVFSKANGGRAAALNFGLRQAHPGSKYVVFLDADDVLHPDFVAKTAALLDANPHIVTCATLAYTFETSIAEAVPLHRSRYTMGRWLPMDLPETQRDTPFFCFYACTGQGPFAMHRRAMIEDGGYLEERLNQGAIHGNEDTDLFCKMALQGRVEYLPERLYYKREHTTNVTKTRDMGYDLFREIWDRNIAKLSEDRPELRLLSKYYRRVHRPFRDLKVARLAARDFRSKPNLKNGVRLLELLSTGGLTLLWGYPWFLVFFNLRRKALKGWI